ncbi:alpha/beta hydrolase [Mycolicibacterium austroafricanum]|uniref:Alpha/beta hydrolase n=1 Tax=Mycolicibacterium austroafricanum TaxID=39687 RepID=A0ABT8H9P3_MYCAO|nr:alpha/beta hydrolase [Mycolicibacterium austroafricanum]MDN4517464.1 alpha/beta hydrolase [Mycolicibacterium austroafricanum]PQP49083.1 alpha/beta hydrolase [Mycolicibacterium austroafricanum]QRZ07576.1 alpha/beta fold hydrolase [Mycolicibacterium austroafricanum]QZT69239.1 alpha/beta hydrolase [Mycolicibacterium austroafricanum]
MNQNKNELTFLSHGIACAAWHLAADTDVLAGAAGRPCVVMAHGFGGTRDTGLIAYAQGFADAGIDALLFDYRGFGDSEGRPRQDVSFRRQRQDYHAAIAAARCLPGVDPDRIALWGTSYSGGHVIAVATQDRRIAGVVAMTPATDGLAASIQIARYGGVRQVLRTVGHGLRDLTRQLTRRQPHHIPVVAQPGQVAIISTSGAEEAYTSIAGPTWRNEVCARTSLEVAVNRPVAYARRLGRPVLVQAGIHDRVAPPAAARRAAEKAGALAELHEYPVDHFDVYDGPWQQRMLDDQLMFLTRVLTPRTAVER